MNESAAAPASAAATPADPAAARPAAQPAAASPAAAQPAPKRRIAYWDNARFLLIVLVVIGHVISTVRTDSSLGFALYSFIYLFHMPAMILLSGLFSKPEASPKAVASTVQLLATWLLWEGVWAVIRAAVEGRAPGSGFLVNPSWTLWFLVTLATMRILLPYIARLRHPLLFSIALALASGLLPAVGTAFSASRTMVFMPFFVAGWLIRERGWLDGQWFTRPARAARIGAWALLGAVGIVFAVAVHLQDFWRIDRWLTWRDDYLTAFERGPIGDWQPTEWVSVSLGGIAVTALLLAMAAALTLAVLIVAPRRQSIITVWGARTLYVYLLHGPVVWVLRETGVIDAVAAWGVAGVLLLTAIAIAIALLLSMTWITRVFRVIIEPRVDWMLRRG
ncbi:acyltransferase family protein [Leucobacter tenebrionis]|uniref:acyltransferase family protein n=1 Tax=Leucobacter tenebrionis TaxID=2873270 RepID=UPI002107F2DF|nr:acyltransferase family protein [Leucobacter tenebrionis]